MNDSINIKIGAEDAGFENTLKTVQDELKSLEGKVNSGDLSFKELERTMKKIGQVEDMEKRLKAMGGESLDAGTKVDKLGKDITDTGNKADKTGGIFDASFAKIAGAVAVGELAVKAFGAVLNAAFDAARSVIEGFKAALDLGGTLSDLSASTGETAGNLLLLQRAFDNSGLGAEKVGPVLAKLSAAINNTDEDSQKAALGFGRMGISLDELQGKSATEQLALVSSGLQSIEDPGQRAAAAIAVFGRSGAELLPLLGNFQGEMGEAAATVGSLAEIMDRRAAVFDAVGDRFKIIQEKVRDFAAGILDRALPAIDAITSALSRIDAAAVGQKLADAFLGGDKAMRGFQSSVDAISIGKVGLAFETFWESLKLQAMQTGEQIYKNLAASLATVRDTIVSMFGPGSGAFTLMIDSFAFAGKAAGVKLAEGILAMVPDINTSLLKVLDILAIVMPGIAAPARLAFEGADKALGLLRGSIGSMNESLEGSKNQLTQSYDKFAANASESFAAIPEGFKQNLGKVPPLFADIQSQQDKVAALESQVKDAVAATNEQRAAGAAQTEAELARRQEIKAAAESAAAAEKAAKTQLIELETQINLAKASGNEELAKSLESQKKELENKAEIKKLTDEYVKTLGVDANEAARLANNFVAAKNAAAGIGDKAAVVSITTTVDDTRWKNLLAELALNSDPKTVAIAMQVTGTDNLQDAYATLQNMETVNKNFAAAFTATGAKSIEEVRANLEGIPTEAQAQLAMQITGEDNLKDAVRNLDRFAGTKEAKLLLESQGFEKMSEFKNQLDGVAGEKRTQLILESLGLADVESATKALNQILANDGKKAAVAVAADTKEAETAIATIGATPQTIKVNAATEEAQTALSALTANPVAITLDATASIESIKAQFREGIDTAINGSEGSKILTTISGFVETIKDLVTKIEPRLPVAALTA